jgi:hypothetical protein
LYEQCRAVFAVGSSAGTDRGFLPDGIVILIKEGMLSWLKRRNSPGSAASFQYRKREMKAPPQNEFIILLATLLGGISDEPASKNHGEASVKDGISLYPSVNPAAGTGKHGEHNPPVCT